MPFPSPGDVPHPGITPVSPALAGGFFTTEPPGKPTLDSKESTVGVPSAVNCWHHTLEASRVPDPNFSKGFWCVGCRSPRAGLLTTDGPSSDLRSKVYCWVLTVLMYIDRHIVIRTFYMKTWFASFFLKNLRIWHHKACTHISTSRIGWN